MEVFAIVLDLTLCVLVLILRHEFLKDFQRPTKRIHYVIHHRVDGRDIFECWTARSVEQHSERTQLFINDGDNYRYNPRNNRHNNSAESEESRAWYLFRFFYTICRFIHGLVSDSLVVNVIVKFLTFGFNIFVALITRVLTILYFGIPNAFRLVFPIVSEWWRAGSRVLLLEEDLEGNDDSGGDDEEDNSREEDGSEVNGELNESTSEGLKAWYYFLAMTRFFYGLFATGIRFIHGLDYGSAVDAIVNFLTFVFSSIMRVVTILYFGILTAFGLVLPIVSEWWRAGSRALDLESRASYFFQAMARLFYDFFATGIPFIRGLDYHWVMDAIMKYLNIGFSILVPLIMRACTILYTYVVTAFRLVFPVVSEWWAGSRVLLLENDLEGNDSGGEEVGEDEEDNSKEAEDGSEVNRNEDPECESKIFMDDAEVEAEEQQESCDNENLEVNPEDVENDIVESNKDEGLEDVENDIVESNKDESLENREDDANLEKELVKDSEENAGLQNGEGHGNSKNEDANDDSEDFENKEALDQGSENVLDEDQNEDEEDTVTDPASAKWWLSDDDSSSSVDWLSDDDRRSYDGDRDAASDESEEQVDSCDNEILEVDTKDAKNDLESEQHMEKGDENSEGDCVVLRATQPEDGEEWESKEGSDFHVVSEGGEEFERSETLNSESMEDRHEYENSHEILEDDVILEGGEELQGEEFSTGHREDEESSHKNLEGDNVALEGEEASDIDYVEDHREVSHENLDDDHLEGREELRDEASDFDNSEGMEFKGYEGSDFEIMDHHHEDEESSHGNLEGDNAVLEDDKQECREELEGNEASEFENSEVSHEDMEYEGSGFEHHHHEDDESNHEGENVVSEGNEASDLENMEDHHSHENLEDDQVEVREESDFENSEVHYEDMESKGSDGSDFEIMEDESSHENLEELNASNAKAGQDSDFEELKHSDFESVEHESNASEAENIESLENPEKVDESSNLENPQQQDPEENDEIKADNGVREDDVSAPRVDGELEEGSNLEAPHDHPDELKNLEVRPVVTMQAYDTYDWDVVGNTSDSGEDSGSDWDRVSQDMDMDN